MTDDQNPNAQTNGDYEEQPKSDGQTETERPFVKVDPANVPTELHALIPYVEKWGILDKEQQQTLLREATLEEVEDLCVILYRAWDDIDRFTIFHDEPESHEMEIFDALRAVFHEAFSILGEEKPERLREIIGWPEAWPGPKLDPAKVPSELHALIPYAEKWVINDEGVRWTAIRAATNEELNELVSAVNQIGDEVIRDLAFKMLDDETQKEEGYIFALLMELEDHAELQLKRRRGGTLNDEIKSE